MMDLNRDIDSFYLMKSCAVQEIVDQLVIYGSNRGLRGRLGRRSMQSWRVKR
jgi:hypothetical protein